MMGSSVVAGGQNPPPPPPSLPSAAQAQQLLQQAQQNPELADSLRQRLQQSGLSPEQIRARLQASGYPSTLLDAYLGTPVPGKTVTPGPLELSAIQALGLPAISVESETLAVDTGMIRMKVSLGRRSPVFGVDAFRRATTQFLPTLSGPVPPDYKLGPGDQLVLILTGQVELAYTLPVTREGFVLIPDVGQVFVTNLTMDQLRTVLYGRLGRVYSGVRGGPNATVRFDISVANVRVNQVYVVGEVTQPGAYQISSLGTVFTALYAAGGVTDRANMRGLEVQRAGKTVATLDLYDYLLRGDTRNDIRLETGDVVFVPVHGTRVQVTGAVVRPAIYDLKPSETLVGLLGAAGGFRADAALKRISVQRILPVAERGPGLTPRAVLDVPLTPARASGGPGDPMSGVVVPDLSLQNGDSVAVDSVPPLVEVYHVGIAGMVNKPGAYAWRPGMTLRDLVLLARGPKVGASLTEAEIARLPQDRAQGQLATTLRVALDSTYLFDRDSLGRYVGPPGVAVPGSGAPEVLLEPYDNVLILKQPDFAFQRTVVIAGEVRYPGTYSLRTKTDRLADLLARAGGLTPRAYPAGIRFVRAVDKVGRINVDLPQATRDTTSSSNLILQPGDSIEIPEYQPAVKVTGAVTSPGSVLWKRGADLAYYLQGAGGFSAQADKGRVSVKYANGEVRTRRKTLFFTSTPKPGPGSEVFVPVRDTTAGRTNYVQLFTSIVQIVASTVTAIYVIKHL